MRVGATVGACRYFRFTLMMLPLEWNTMASESMDGGRTIGGIRPRIVHFTEVTKMPGNHA